MKAIKTIFKTRAEWLENRKHGIGGSEAAAVINKSPWLTRERLFDLKTGRAQPSADIAERPQVKYGTAAEPLLRELFALDYPQYAVEYEENNSYAHPQYPFLMSSRDANLTETATGRKGVYEGKTAEIRARADADKWDNAVPENYYCQILQYFVCDPEIDFVILNAQLKFYGAGGQMIRKETRPYHFERKYYAGDIESLQNAEIEFWAENVLKDRRPNMVLSL